MNEGAKKIMIAVVAMLAGAAGTMAATAPDAPVTSRAEIEKIVREYILAHPEILPEAMDNLERKGAADAVSSNRARIETPFGSAWEGAANGDVTLVKFYDYACGYCRSSRPDIDRLLAEDKGLRIVYRELPILGAASDDATRASLAVAKLGGNYAAFHKAMYAGGRPNPGLISKALATAGVSEAQAKTLASSPDIAAEVTANLDLQRKLRLTGTPSWVIGNRVAIGAVGYDELKKLIADQRAGK